MYTELDYLQEEVLGYFTEDKSDIDKNREMDAWTGPKSKKQRREEEVYNKKKYGQADPSTRSRMGNGSIMGRSYQSGAGKRFQDQRNNNDTEWLKSKNKYKQQQRQDRIEKTSKNESFNYFNF